MIPAAVNAITEVLFPAEVGDCQDCHQKVAAQKTSRDLKHWKERFIIAADKLIIVVTNQTESAEEHVATIEKCIKTIENISLIGHEHDFEGVEANGYRSFVKLWAKVFHTALQMKSIQEQIEFLNVIKKLDIFYDYLESYHNQKLYIGYDDGVQKQFSYEFQDLFRDGKLFQLFHSPQLNLIHMNSGMRFAMGMFMRFMPFMLPRTSVVEKIKAIFSERSMAKVMSKNMSTMSVFDVKHLMSWGNTTGNVLSAGGYLGRKLFGWDSTTRVQNVTTQIRSQYLLDVTVDGLSITKCGQKSGRMSKIRYQIARTIPKGESKYDKKVLIFVHGGAFVGPKADAMEHVCIRQWARSMPGITVVNIDYTLCPEARFPTQIQELLDFYLWLLNPDTKSEVIDSFGFVPDDIGFIGESSGGHQCASLYVLLNELKELHDSTLKLPKALMLMYPKLSINFQTYPSIVSTLVEPIIFPQVLPVCYHTYVPMKKFDTSTGRFRLLPQEEQMKIPATDITNEENGMIQNIILTPIEYGKFDGLKNTSLNILTSEFDPFLDEAVLLAKRWQGKVNLKVLDDLGHAANVFAVFDKEGEKAAQEIVDLIKNAFLN